MDNARNSPVSPFSPVFPLAPGSAADAAGGEPSDGWDAFVTAFRGPTAVLPGPWQQVFGPLRSGAADDLMVVGQVGQSLDGRIATPSGHSKYINGPAGLIHLHRLRALVDAVVIGVGTALSDDPQLTVRRVTGPHPARVIIDSRGRLGAAARVWAADGVRRLLVTAEGSRCAAPTGVEVAALPAGPDGIAPADILAALAQRGMHRILVEGGAETVSRFLRAGCLDRLHILVAPIILGAGPAGLVLPPVERADEAMRVAVRSIQLDGDLLLDCDLSAHRVTVGLAKKST
jgi:riboflavin-specific deaminase-like protein